MVSGAMREMLCFNIITQFFESLLFCVLSVNRDATGQSNEANKGKYGFCHGGFIDNLCRRGMLLHGHLSSRQLA